MGRSSSKRATPKRNLADPTAFQTRALCGNIGGHQDWDTNPWYKNAMTSARGFGTKQNGNIIANLDAQGWPADNDWQCALSTDTDGVPGVLVLGTYHCSVQNVTAGDGFPIERSNDCVISNTVLQPDGLTWLFTLQVTGLVVLIQGAGWSAGPGMLHLVIPQVGYDLTTVSQGDRFLPKFLSYWRQYTGMRFMSASGVNDGSNWDPTLGIWANRVTPSNSVCGWTIATPAGTMYTGVPLEIRVELSNAIKKLTGSVYRRHWDNIIHNADDDFVVNWLRYLRDNLDTDIEVYIELSNETWNYMFSQAAYFYSLSQDPVWALAHQIAYDGETDANWLRARAMAARAYEIQQMAVAVWAERPGYRAPFKMILGGQFASPIYYHSNVAYLEYISGAPINESFYGVAIAPYFNVAGYTSYTPDEMYSRALASMESYPEHGWYDPYGPGGDGIYGRMNGVKYMKEFSVIFKLKLLCYEGGWDNLGLLSGGGPSGWTDMLLQHRSAGLIEHYLDLMFRAGVAEFYWYTNNPGKWSRVSDINYTITQTSLEIDPPLLGYKNFGNKTVPQPDQVNAHNYLPFAINDTTTTLVKAFVTMSHDSTLTTDTSYGGFYGPLPISGDVLYSSMRSDADRWFDMAIYVPHTGTYEVKLFGRGGTWLNKTVEVAGGTPSTAWGGTAYKTVLLDTNGNPAWDNLSDGNFRWQLFISELNTHAFTLLTDFVPPVGGTNTTLIQSNDIQAVALNEGWQTLRVIGHTPDLCRSASGMAGLVWRTTVDTAGASYTAPVVTFSAPDIATGLTATGVAFVNGTTGGIDHIWVTFGGTGYLTVPSVTITDSTGAGCVATAYFNVASNGYYDVYQTDQYGNNVLDSYGNPIVLFSIMNSSDQGVHHLTFKRLT